MSVLGVLVGFLAVRVGCLGMLFSFLVFSHFVMMGSLAVVVRRRLVVSGCIVMVLACGVLH